MPRKKFTWKDEVDLYFQYAKMDGVPVQGGSISEPVLNKFIQTEKFPVDPEFIALYSYTNGFGHKFDQEMYWKTLPIEKIPEVIQLARDWFAEDYPELASRFFPFIDWNCGDYTGYLLDENGEKLEGLYTFHHEEFEFDSEQDPEEFLSRSYDSIVDYVH